MIKVVDTIEIAGYTIRPYADSSDLKQQEELWNERNLQYIWKHTRNYELAALETTFDRDQLMFIYRNDDLMGYMGYTRDNDSIFVDPPIMRVEDTAGRKELYEYYESLIKQKNPDAALLMQRVRESWEDELIFFQQQQYRVDTVHPMYVRDIGSTPVLHRIDNYRNQLKFQISPGFSLQTFLSVVGSTGSLDKEFVEIITDSLNQIKYDYAILVQNGPAYVGYFAFTIHNEFAELLTSTFVSEQHAYLFTAYDYINNFLMERGVTKMGLTLTESDPFIELLEHYGFKYELDDVYVSKYLI